MKSQSRLPWRTHWLDDWAETCREAGITFIERSAVQALLDHQWRTGYLPAGYADVRGLLAALGAPAELFKGSQPRIRVAHICDVFFPLVSPDEVRRNAALHDEWERARLRSADARAKGKKGAEVRYGRPAATPPARDQDAVGSAVPLDVRSPASEALSASSDDDDGSGSDDDEDFDDVPF